MMLRAYSVTAIQNRASVLVFAETPSQAKQRAHSSEWLDDEMYRDLRAKREPEADSYADIIGPNRCDMETVEEQSIAWALGWCMLEFSGSPCVTCGRYAWQLVGESHQGEDGECHDCKARRVPKSEVPY